MACHAFTPRVGSGQVDGQALTVNGDVPATGPPASTVCRAGRTTAPSACSVTSGVGGHLTSRTKRTSSGASLSWT